MRFKSLKAIFHNESFPRLAAILLPTLLTACASTAMVNSAQQSIEATAESYAGQRSAKGVVLVGVNWGRTWACGAYQNAELRIFAFDRMPTTKKSNEEGADIVLHTGPNLLRRQEYIGYALLVEPGEYALAGFAIKVMPDKLVSDTPQYWVAGRSDLAKYGADRGGRFSVAANETVYLGHFDIKCTAAGPKLWRVRAKEGEDFAAYLADLKRKYPFLELKQTQYRLFQTTEFGHQYDQP